MKDAEIFVTSYNGERKKYQTDEHGWIQGLPNRDIREGFTAVYSPDGEVVYRMHYALEDYPYFSVHFWKAHLPLVVIFALAGIGIVAVYLIRNRMEKHNPVADDDISEITAHAYGVRVTAPKEYRPGMVIDIGGQDSKIIYLDANYNVKNFTMNDKCAAGTGKFMEVIAQILETTIDQVGALSLESTSPCDINSTCVVFAQSKVISLVARKVDRRDILAGMHLSMAKRIIKMMKKSEKGGDILMTGGGALNTGISLAKSGQIKTIGVSNHNLMEIKRANEILAAEAYNPHLKELTALIDELKIIGTRFDASPAQVATAWAIAKGTLPIIGVTKVRQVEEAAKAAQIELTVDEISRLERLGDETGVHTLREWEKEM